MTFSLVVAGMMVFGAGEGQMMPNLQDSFYPRTVLGDVPAYEPLLRSEICWKRSWRPPGTGTAPAWVGPTGSRRHPHD